LSLFENVEVKFHEFWDFPDALFWLRLNGAQPVLPVSLVGSMEACKSVSTAGASGQFGRFNGSV
jgi:hypothetical protein